MASQTLATARAQHRPLFRYDGDGSLARIGLIYMASSVVMESEMWAMAAEGVSIHTTRIKLPKVTVEGIEQMMNAPQLEEAARLLGSAPIDVLCFGGTSASFLHGTAYDHALTEKLKLWAPGKKINTASTATLAALRAVRAGPIALATPYVDGVHQRAIRFLEENGHEVLRHRNLGIDKDTELAQVSLDEVYDLVRSVDHPDATAVFISCTNFRSAGALEAMETALGKPVISAIQASFWHCLTIAGVKGARPGFGNLMRDVTA
ncbi:maleate isomerase [Pseudaminobacter salicylatoxidans]|uniref:Maleate isomerase n=1 Tax=Pseudaminobacter salicylatoxidans TaxID=93369 RepID=A0A316C671_PSESE|nr:Asp/Glu racemase [Pseudaminobacter salicylatoxidans]PWJ84526.1 maleate isomerase [Pseudaminobacter salicylatoxidans]